MSLPDQRWIPLLLPVLLSGCAAGFQQGLRIDPAPQTLHTNQLLHLTASLHGDPVPAAWHISSDNASALGSGTITGEGLYTPPSTLSRDEVTVTLSAGGSSASAETTLTLTPAFAQPLQPENAMLTPGAAIELRAQLAEVTAGTVRWALPGPEAGSLTNSRCTRSPTQFTTCTVLYTAPQTLPVGTRVAVTATGPGGSTAQARLLIGQVNSNPVLHQQEQRAPIALGASGSNDGDFDTLPPASQADNRVADCCGGTLGALVEDPKTGTPYLLSNNHVLAASDQARPGDTIEHPGLIDDACVPLTSPGAKLHPVATLRYAVPLSRATSNVDAALASVPAGAVDPTGAILELGPEADASAARSRTLRAAPPTAGRGETLTTSLLDHLRVAKSGRTTGLTCSSVEAVDLTVEVDYFKDCAETRPYTRHTFTGQIAIAGDSFADSGDSGALVLDAENAQAVGLLYATADSGSPATDETKGNASGGLTLANPIADVLAELGAEMHPDAPAPLLLRGSAAPHKLACLDYDAGLPSPRPSLASLAPDERTRSAAAAEAAAGLHSSMPSIVLAAAPGVSADSPGEGAVVLYIDRVSPRPALPATIDGVRTVVLLTDSRTIAQGPASWPLPTLHSGLHLSPVGFSNTRSVLDRRAAQLLRIPGIFGAGLAQSQDDPEQPAILVLVDPAAISLKTAEGLGQLTGQPPGTPTLPAMLDGVRLRYLRLRRFHVTRSKHSTPRSVSACSLGQLRQ